MKKTHIIIPYICQAMRLKSLEIKGFKSFANPTILYFDENVTGVVGPNGSGKSNVVDAFRWVLGEQKSKELRLEQMGDVLFNGSAGKKQANFAEVSITFDNTKNILPTEYNNVKITRALYRSGDSEYRINDVNCRLKDIHALLMDTGIGSNSYSIIELGMVDDILHDKENARRRMFEQAAGISKFKKRKKETIQKLKLTNADLERVEDLLFEIENNLKDLEKQARRTKRFFEIKEKYKTASTVLHKLKWEANVAAADSINKQVSENRQRYNDLKVALTNKEALLEKEKQKNLVEEKNLSDFQRKLNELLDEIRQLENEKNLLRQKINYAANSLSNAHQNLSNNKPLLEEALRRKEELLGQKATKESEYQSQKEILKACQESVDGITEKFQTNKQFQEEHYKELQVIQMRIFDTDKMLAVSINRSEGLEREIKNNKEQAEAIRSRIGSEKEELGQLESKADILRTEIKSLEEQESKRKEDIEIAEQRIKSQKESLAKLNRTIDALKNEQDLLKSMVANLEGFSESVKYLHSNWKAQKVMLSDVINSEDVYRAAVEQFLSPYLNYFIVSSAEEARSAIEMLKQNQKGKAQFFLLDQVKPKKVKRSIDLLALADVIEVDEKYKSLLALICDGVYILPEKDFYNEEILAKYEDITLIGPNGSLLRTQNQITGGSVGLFEGKKIGRKKRIDHLEKEIAKQTKSKEKLVSEIAKTESAYSVLKNERLDVEIQLKQKQKSSLESSILVLKSKLENADHNISNFESKNLSIQEELSAIKKERENHISSKTQDEQQSDKLKAEMSKYDDQVNVLSEELSLARTEYNQKNIQLIQAENFVLTLSKDIDYQDQRAKELKQTLYDAEKSIDELTREEVTTKRQLEKVSKQLENKFVTRDKEKEQLSTAEQDYFKARGELNNIEDELRKLSKSLNDKQFIINQLKDKLNDFKFANNSIKERINIEFGLDIKDLLAFEIEKEESETEIQMEVEKFKRRLENYGEINPMALEAYAEMEERFNHIKEQRNDILEAKESLMDTISEIEETATNLFLESFEEVRKHFVVVFRSLFTQDDDCDLVLEAPDDPLNSKIEIIAKPKGKRPKSLSQLSGGEKTLTATALLFSLYLLKPAPFCIFDEVDAPLDDTNIQKFANIIRAFSDKSQFIIVTHNKSTMAEVDVLYGVYMQKKGVSSVSSVDFRSYEEKGTVQNVGLSTVGLN